MKTIWLIFRHDNLEKGYYELAQEFVIICFNFNFSGTKVPDQRFYTY
jgi:hypothetical protein